MLSILCYCYFCWNFEAYPYHNSCWVVYLWWTLIIKNIKSFSHKAALISVFLAISQTPVYTAIQWMQGWCIAQCACLPPPPAFAVTHCVYLWRDGPAELTWMADILANGYASQYWPVAWFTKLLTSFRKIFVKSLHLCPVSTSYDFVSFLYEFLHARLMFS